MTKVPEGNPTMNASETPVLTNLVIACGCGSRSAASALSSSECFISRRYQADGRQTHNEVDSRRKVRIPGPGRLHV
jgi:hypothetical protein